jgi:hypothetical protein
MKSQRFMQFVHHRQPNAAQSGLIQKLAVFFPAMQGGQRVKLSLDGPIGTNHRIGPVHEPKTHHTL